jgi:hypothetical protein
VIVVSAYTAASAIILATGDAGVQKTLFAVIVIVGILATIGEFVIVRGLDWNSADPKKKIIARVQITVGVVAFAIWSYAQADWAVSWDVFQGAAAALLVIAAGLLIYFAEPLADRVGGA